MYSVTLASPTSKLDVARFISLTVIKCDVCYLKDKSSATSDRPISLQARLAVIDCGSDASVSCLNSPGKRCVWSLWAGALFRRLRRTAKIRPFISSSTIAELGHRSRRGRPLKTIITDLMSSQYSDPVRVVAFNTAEHWSEDTSVDVAREILRRLDLAGDALPSSIAAFVDRHLGPDRQLALRLAGAGDLGSAVFRSD
jgi:hypothetical protein